MGEGGQTNPHTDEIALAGMGGGGAHCWARELLPVLVLPVLLPEPPELEPPEPLVDSPPLPPEFHDSSPALAPQPAPPRLVRAGGRLSWAPVAHPRGRLSWAPVAHPQRNENVS